jgi:aldose 1-epimerase
MSVATQTVREDGVVAVTVDTPALRFRVVSLGATVTSVAFNNNGAWTELTAAFDDLGEQLADDAYMGATCGRYTGRIAKGQFTLDGVARQLTLNNNGNTLHGGVEGFNRRNWDLVQLLDGSDAAGGRVGAVFRLASPDDDQGFPAALDTTAAYFTVPSAAKPGLHMKFDAEIPAAASGEQGGGFSTVVNIVNHNYWNLNGYVRGRVDDAWPQPASVENHVMQIDASTVTVMNADSVSTGPIAPVEGTPFDFRQPTVIGSRIEQAPLDRPVPGYDDNFILDGPIGTLRKVATVSSPLTGIAMDIATTLPALQVYTTNYKPKGATGFKGDRFGFRSAVCLETQFFPNAPNCPNFPSTVLRPGEKWAHETVYSLYAAAQ